jgi:hypothetical protein
LKEGQSISFIKPFTSAVVTSAFTVTLIKALKSKASRKKEGRKYSLNRRNLGRNQGQMGGHTLHRLYGVCFIVNVY